MLFGRQTRHVKRILIVEDEPLVAFDNEVMVANAGYTVVATVDRVADALIVLEQQLAGAAEEADTASGKPEERGVDLILTDISLSGERTGLDLASEAKTFGVPVLFATAAPPEGGEAFGLGVLLKPYNERRLKAALKAIEQRLAGQREVSVPEGMILYSWAGAEDE